MTTILTGVMDHACKMAKLRRVDTVKQKLLTISKRYSVKNLVPNPII